jgi:hypothetical protein
VTSTVVVVKPVGVGKLVGKMTRHSIQEADTVAVQAAAAVETNGPFGRHGQRTIGASEVLWRQLADATAAGDAQAFVTAYHLIDWSTRTPDEFERAIHWALAAGAHLTARSLATAGAAQYPDDAELQKAARILAPPKLLRRLPAEPEKRANHAWLRVNRAAYRGKWVALRNGDLLATANAFHELTEQIPIAPDILFTKVF